MLILCLGLVPGIAFAHHADTVSLHKAAQALNKALVEKDSSRLLQLLHEELSYGHSNGWVESKREVIGNLFNGTLSYQAIQPLSETIVITGKTGILRMKGDFEVQLGSSVLRLKLAVMQVWVWQQQRWQLASRQSVKTE